MATNAASLTTPNDNDNSSMNNGSESFESAMAALYSSEHQARTKQAIEKAAMRRELTVLDVREYLRRAGITTQLPSSIVHITGTKGKGSTAAMCESILRGNNQKTGLYTSPHLVDIRERIRIDGRPVSEQTFGQAYWRVRRKLEACNDNGYDDSLPVLPGYFRMLTVMAMYIFFKYEPALDVIILEVGMGGRYDATNIFDVTDKRKIVCGVTLLDLDHTRVLGDTLEQIAWEKGGIFSVQKVGVNTISPRPDHTDDTQQLPESETAKSSANSDRRFYAIATNTPSVLQVLRGCAAVEGQGGKLVVVEEDPNVQNIGLPGSHQRINAALALALCNDVCPIPSAQESLRTVAWPGRCQTVQASEHVTLHLDGAHTPKSLAACLEWYTSTTNISNHENVLIFNCSHERNPVQLLQQLQQNVKFAKVYFCPADFERPSGMGKPRAATLLQDLLPLEKQTNLTPDDAPPPTWQETLAEIWRFLDTENASQITVNIKVKEALDEIILSSENQQQVNVLVAGSLYLVGSALSAVQWEEPSATGGLLL